MSIRAKVRAQTLDDRVTIERKTSSDTASGGVVDSWATLIVCRARVDGAKASTKASSPEPVIDGGIRMPRDYTVWIRADVFVRFAITALDRIRWRTYLLSIADIPDQGAKGGLVAAICRVGINKG